MLLFFITGTSGIFAQRPVTGTVLDADKQPVVGANVVVKGTSVGAITDINGKYSITVSSATSIIAVSFIGYVPQEVVAGNSTVIDFTLQTSALALDEIVVIGYGTVNRRDITGYV